MGQRLGMGAGALASIGAAVTLVLLGKELDLLTTSLVVVAGILYLLAMIGRLPHSFEVAGLSLDYDIEPLADALGTIRGSDLDDASKARILKLLETSASNPDVYQSASKMADESQESPTDTDDRGGHSVSELGHGEPDEFAWIRKIADDDHIQEDFTVPGSGKGKAPKVDYFFKVGGKGVAAEFVTYWNPSTLDLLNRRLSRVLGKSTPVEHAIVVAPDKAVSKVEKELADLPFVEVYTNRRLQEERTREELREKIIS